jgi:proteasome lid subunit RPN8/RPN11
VTPNLAIAPALLAAIREAALRAQPDECCGLIEGEAVPDGWRAVAVHAAKNVSDDPARSFVVDAETHFRLLRALRDTPRAIIGCFHSHPGGVPVPSARDRNAAVDDNFVWLIAADDRICGYVFRARSGRFEDITLRQGG